MCGVRMLEEANGGGGSGDCGIGSRGRMMVVVVEGGGIVVV